MEESSTTKKETHQQTPSPISYSPCLSLFIQQLRAAYLKCLGMEDASRSPSTEKTDGKEAKLDDEVPGATPSPEEGSAGSTGSDPVGSSAENAGSVAADPVVDDPPADASDDPNAITVSLRNVPPGSNASTGSGPGHN